jgi:DNA modification methylase
VTTIRTDEVEFVKELYPRLREDDTAIERYRAAIDRLPPIVVARGRILVDGFHRWQAHKREGLEVIEAEDLGNLADAEILKESVRRNASHGRQLETKDKKRMADLLWRQGTRDEAELCDLLSITPSTLETYLRDAKRDEKQQQQERAWDLWLDCHSEREIAEAVLDDAEKQKTINNWLSKFRIGPLFTQPPESRQHFDVWSFQTAADDAGTGSYFGRMPPQVVENLLWLYTEPGQIVVDPFAGGGTTIDVAKRMGRRVWASDLNPSTPTLPIHQHDATTGWPTGAPRKADLVLLDPPYWQQAKGRYSDDPADLGNRTLEAFYADWAAVVKACADHAARIAYIISPTQLEDGTVVDHATDMLAPFRDSGWRVERRIIVTYQTQQATGQQVTWARENRRLLKLYRDLVVLTP